jgi:hypothetical protein
MAGYRALVLLISPVAALDKTIVGATTIRQVSCPP